MLTIITKLDGDNAWPELADDQIIHVAAGAPPIQIAVLAMGMKSGRPSVGIRVDLPDGRSVIAETSARLFCSAARLIMGRYPGLFEGGD